VIQNLLQAAGHNAKLLCFAAQGGINPAKLATSITKHVPDAKHHNVIAMNYPRRVFGDAFDNDTRFCTWMTQSGLSWFDLEDDRAAFNDSHDIIFGYVEELLRKGWDGHACFESQFAVPCVDMLTYAQTPVHGRDIAISMISNRGGTAQSYVERELQDHPHYGWLLQKAAATDGLCKHDLFQNGIDLLKICEWEQALPADMQEILNWGIFERGYRYSVARQLNASLGDQFSLHGQGWGDAVMPLTVPGMSGVLARSHYAVHASHELWWHHRLAETLLCGCIPLTRAGTAGCIDFSEEAAEDFRRRYISGCRRTVEFVADLLSHKCGVLHAPTLPPTPVKFYKNLAELSSIAQSLI
jgi:hypothetical protein